MEKIYIVELLDDQRRRLLDLTSSGTCRARMLKRAHILLQADAGATDPEIAAALHVGRSTVERTRRRDVLEGFEAAMNERPRPGGGASSMANRKPLSSPSPVAPRQRAAAPGPCSCWPTTWSRSRSWTPSRMKPCAAP